MPRTERRETVREGRPRPVRPPARRRTARRAALRPARRSRAGAARRDLGPEHREGGLEHRPLSGGIARRPERVAVPERHPQAARRRRLGRRPVEELQGDRRDAGALELDGHQSHGPAAERSGGHEEGGVDRSASRRGTAAAARRAPPGRSPPSPRRGRGGGRRARRGGRRPPPHAGGRAPWRGCGRGWRRSVGAVARAARSASVATSPGTSRKAGSPVAARGRSRRRAARRRPSSPRGRDGSRRAADAGAPSYRRGVARDRRAPQQAHVDRRRPWRRAYQRTTGRLGRP